MGLESIIGGAVGLGGTLLGAEAGAGAARSAAAAQERSAREARELTERLFERQVALQEPFREAGIAGVTGLAEQFRMPLRETEAFRFQQQAGERSINRALAARGLLRSGAGIEAQSRFTGELGIQEVQRRQQLGQFLTQTGTGAAAGISGAAGQAAGRLGQLTQNIGAAQAGGALGAGQAQQQAFGQLGNLGLFVLGRGIGG